MASTDKDHKEEEEVEEAAACSWWWDSLSAPQQSQWLQTTLSDFDRKTKAILNIMQDAERAEMYYKKRPELVEMVEDLGKSYRSLAVKYDQLRSDSIHAGYPIMFSSSNSSKQVQQLQNPHKNIVVEFTREEAPTSHPESVHEDDDHLETETCNAVHFEFLNRLTNDYLMSKGSSKMKVVNADENFSKEETNKRTDSTRIESNGWSSDQLQLLFLEREKMWSQMSLQVSELVKDNLREHEKLIRRNEQKREDMKKLYSEVNSLMEENKTLKTCQAKYKVHKKQNQTQGASIFKKLFSISFKT